MKKSFFLFILFLSLTICSFGQSIIGKWISKSVDQDFGHVEIIEFKFDKDSSFILIEKLDGSLKDKNTGTYTIVNKSSLILKIRKKPVSSFTIIKLTKDKLILRQKSNVTWTFTKIK